MSSIHEFLLHWGFRSLPVPAGGDPKYLFDGIEVRLISCPSPIAENNTYKLIDRSGNIVSEIPFGYAQLTGYCLLGVKIGRPIFCGFIFDGKKHGLVEDFPEGRDPYLARYSNNKIVSFLFRLKKESSLFCEITPEGQLLYVENVNSQKLIYGIRYEYIKNRIRSAYDVGNNFERMKFDEGKVTVYNLSGKVYYTGDYLDNVYCHYCFHGQGELHPQKGLIYKGSFACGKRDGMGELFRNEVLVYKGSWKEDVPEGEGTLYNSDGSVRYSGKFSRGYYEDAPQIYTHYLTFEKKGEKSVFSANRFDSSFSSSSSLIYAPQPENWWYTRAVKQRCAEISAKEENPEWFTCSLADVDVIQDLSTRHITTMVETMSDFNQAAVEPSDLPNTMQSLYFRFSPENLRKFSLIEGQMIEEITIGANLFLDCRSFVLKNLPALQSLTVERNSFSNDMSLPYDLKFEVSQMPLLKKIVIYENSFQHFNYFCLSGICAAWV